MWLQHVLAFLNNMQISKNYSNPEDGGDAPEAIQKLKKISICLDT